MRKKLTLAWILLAITYVYTTAAQSTYTIDFPGRGISFLDQHGSQTPDTFLLEFNLYEGHGTSRERRIREHIPTDIQVMITETMRERVDRIAPEYIPGSLLLRYAEGGTGSIPLDITVSLLVDRSGSIRPGEMQEIRRAIEAFWRLLPEGSLFLSYFHNHISPSYQLTVSNFQAMADSLLTVTPYHTDLYNAITTKVLEFDSLAVIPNQRIDEQFGYRRNPDLARRNSRYNYLIVLTDGADDAGMNYAIPNPKYLNPAPGFKIISEQDVINTLETYKDHLSLFTLGYQVRDADYERDILQKMAEVSGGAFFEASPEELLAFLESDLPGHIGVDYQAAFTYPPGKVFRGEARNLSLNIANNKGEALASGTLLFSAGSPVNPYITGGSIQKPTLMLRGILIGFLFLFVMLIIIQLVWPLINNKIFYLRYQKTYHPAIGEIKRECCYCRDPLHENQKVIDRCSHVVHKACWVANAHMCPEFGQNCTVGKQNYFDVNDPFSRKNKLHSLNWGFFGMLGGFLSWLLYAIIRDAGLFSNTVLAVAKWLRPQLGEPMLLAFSGKTAPSLVIGLILGFFLGIFFAYTEEYRKINWMVALKILIRGLAGSLIGFISFFLGGMLLLSFGWVFTNHWTDWVPWLLFGSIFGLALSFKTTIHWKHGLLGGLFSILFSFIIIYYLSQIDILSLLVALMIYGGGVGLSIATVRKNAELYFLRILNGPREGKEIAIHKWMNSQGNLNAVHIGTDNYCEININWEKSQEVAPKHVKLFINQDVGAPVLVSLEKGKTTLYDDRVEMAPGKEYELLNGTTFTIGSTTFQYVEKS